MQNPYKARVNRREFLNLPGIHDGAYVIVYVEDTTEREIDPEASRYSANPHPRFILEIADCAENINLEFEVDSALRRKNSFHKIDTLIEALQEFREGMAEEASLYKKREHQLDEIEKEKTKESSNK